MKGEKDCGNLAKYGFFATTVYIIADNDEVGNNHALEIAKSLTGKATSISMVDVRFVMPQLSTDGDISDYIDSVPVEERKSSIADLLANGIPYVPEESDLSEKKDSSVKEDGKVSQAEPPCPNLQ